MRPRFGTDGLRGRANRELTPELAVRVGFAAGQVLADGRPGVIILGRDTRESGPMLEAAVAAGLASAGWQVRPVGVMTSPGVACLTVLAGADAGCVISASHNPAPDNGIKFFTREGAKLSPATEARIEALLDADAAETAERPRPGLLRPWRGAAAAYRHFLAATTTTRLDGLRLVVDCANGAASALAPTLFRALGAEVRALCHHPDGRNINDRCGATHPGLLAEAVRRAGADAGVAFDGDADRAIFVDERGLVRNGDHVLYVLATQRLADGQLPGEAIVGTVMTNLGTERALAEAGIRLERARVGDREVYAQMRQAGILLGGEQSGHIIFLDHLNTGDGMLTAIQLFAAMRRAGKPLSVLCAPVVMFPQILINIPLLPGLDWHDSTPLGQALRDAEALLLGEGRVLVRPSGTEPLLRVMLESPRAEALQQAAQRVRSSGEFPGLKATFLSAEENPHS
ncbi:MAG: phosphoglucosamine mutase [Armatimonadetes bacterium]|nr:phosphoglucosamine mutase [Armatimonadota bacterium]